jgi:aromatic-amino-acid transaminase
MFEHLKVLAADPILTVVTAYRADPRPGQIDLGIGVYKDAEGATPIMAAVRDAQQRLLGLQTTKAYVGPTGDESFNQAMIELVFGADRPGERVRAIQTPGGSGALRMAMDLIKNARPDATIWLSDPTWPNHHLLAASAGLKIGRYPYFDGATKLVRFADMMAALRKAAAGDAVLLHGCCHNPTGADLDPGQWQAVADLVAERGLLAFVDIAYQGLGDGLDEDAAGVRLLAGQLDEMIVTASCSKNFGLYRDRAGCAFMLAANAWRAELDGMRGRINGLRRALVEALRRRSNDDRFDFIADHRGLFSLTGLSAVQVAELRERHGIYLIGDGRMNVAGLAEHNVETFADALMAVTSAP